MNGEFYISEKEIDEKVKFLSSAKCNHTQHMYIDITGDLVQGTLLARIMYWFAPGKNKKSKVRIFKDGYFWIAKQRRDWWDEIRITERQYDKAISELKKKGFVELAKYKFDSMPTIHIRPNYDNINAATEKWEDELRKKIIEEYQEELQKSKNGNYAKCNSHRIDIKCKTGITQEGNLLTLITNNDYNTEITNRDYPMYTSEKDKSFPEEEKDMYTSFLEGESTSTNDNKKKSRYIPENYTEKQIVEHVYPIVVEEISNQLEDNIQETVANFLDMFRYFHRKYYEVTGRKHKVLADISYRSIVRDFLFPPHVMSDKDEMYSPEAYSEMIDLYFKIDLNQRGNYDGEITRNLPHFMSDGIREYTYMRTRL